MQFSSFCIITGFNLLLIICTIIKTYAASSKDILKRLYSLQNVLKDSKKVFGLNTTLCLSFGYNQIKTSVACNHPSEGGNQLVINSCIQQRQQE